MWIMLMHRIASALAMGHRGEDASSASGARTFASPASATQAAIDSRDAASGSLGCQSNDGNAAAKCTACRSEEHTSELQSLMRISYAVFCLKKKKNKLTCRSHKIH